MNNLEKVEKLREKADVTYEEAKAVLEECDWDLLEAVLTLEARGKIKEKTTASYSTNGQSSTEGPKNPQQVAESYQHYQENKEKEKGAFHTIWEGIKYLFHKGCENRFVVRKNGEQIMEIPVILMILLMIAFFWCLLILMVVSLFFGFSYGFAGPDLGKENVNNAMNKATEAAENLKTEVKEKEKEKNNNQQQ